MSRFKSLLIATVGLWAAEVMDWANAKLSPPQPMPEPSPEPDPDAEPSLEEKTRAVLDNLAVACEYADLPSHLGLVNVVAIQWPDGTRGLAETHEGKWNPAEPTQTIGYLVKPEGESGPALRPILKAKGVVAHAVRTDDATPAPEARASTDLGSLVALASQHVAESDRLDFQVEMLGFFQTLLSGGQVVHADLVHRCAYWLRRNGHVVKVDEIG